MGLTDFKLEGIASARLQVIYSFGCSILHRKAFTSGRIGLPVKPCSLTACEALWFAQR